MSISNAHYVSFAETDAFMLFLTKSCPETILFAEFLTNLFSDMRSLPKLFVSRMVYNHLTKSPFGKDDY